MPQEKTSCLLHKGVFDNYVHVYKWLYFLCDIIRMGCLISGMEHGLECGMEWNNISYYMLSVINMTKLQKQTTINCI